jgi:S1-C subfamily serine protease
VAAAIAVVVLFVTGVFGGGGDDPSAKTSTELDIPAIIDSARASTGLVVVSQDGAPVGSGTGWVFDAEQGFVVTNQHVVNGGSQFAVRIADRDRPATVVASAPCDDLALLKVTDTEGLKSVTLGSQAELRQGETVVAVGFPGSASETPNLTATTGLVSVVRESFDLRAIDVPQYPNVIQTDAAINPGNSGGPLFDTRGLLVGVNSAGITLLGDRTIQGQGYAIGVDRVKEVMASLATGTSLGWTGMAFDYREGAPGLVVVDVVPDTPAALAGLGEPDVLIREVNGTPIDNSLPSYCDAVEGIDAGDSATFLVEQEDGTTSDLRVAFHGRPPSQ